MFWKSNFYFQNYFLLCIICFLYEAFLDKGLSVPMRLYRIWFVRSFFTIWRDWLVSKQIDTDVHFLDAKTYTDLILTCEGFVHYLLLCIKNKMLFVPQYLNRDHLEQAWAYISTGMYAGRRTAIDSSLLVSGLKNRNRSVEMFRHSRIEKFSVAHTRSKAILTPLSDDPEDFTPHDVSGLTFDSVFVTVKYLCNKNIKGVSFENIYMSDELEFNITVSK